MKKSILSIAVLAIGTLCHQGAHSFLGPCTPLLAPVKAAVVNAALASKIGSLTTDQFQEALGSYKDFCNKEGVVGAVRLNAKGTHLVIRGRTLSNKNNKIALDALNNYFVELEKMAKSAERKQKIADALRFYSYEHNNKEWIAEWNQLLDAQREELKRIKDDQLTQRQQEAQDWDYYAKWPSALEVRKRLVKAALKQRQQDVSDLNDKYTQAWVDYAVQMKALHEAEVADAALTQRQLDEQAWEGCWDWPKDDSFDWKQFVKDNKEPLIAAGIVVAGGAGLYAGKKAQEQSVEA